MSICQTLWMFYVEEEKKSILEEFIKKINNCVTTEELEQFGRTYEFVAAALRDDVTIKHAKNGTGPYLKPNKIDCCGGEITYIHYDDYDDSKIKRKACKFAIIHTNDKWLPNVKFWTQMTSENEKFSDIKFMYEAKNMEDRIFINSDPSRKLLDDSYAVCDCHIPSFSYKDHGWFSADDFIGTTYSLSAENPLNDLNKIIKGLADAYTSDPNEFEYVIDVKYLKPKKTLNEAIMALNMALERYLKDDDPFYTQPAVLIYEYVTPTYEADKG